MYSLQVLRYSSLLCVCKNMCILCVLRLTEIRDRTRQITEEIRHLEQDSEAAQGNPQDEDGI